MARNEIVIDAPPEAVYETLMDASAYPQWVVGAKKLRGTDDSWPKRGSRFHHRVGVGPLTLDDTTKLVDAHPNRNVTLEVRARPLGHARVTLDLRAKARGKRTKVVMRERSTGGVWTLIPRPVERTLIHVRNAASLRRLRTLVQSRDGQDRSSRAE